MNAGILPALEGHVATDHPLSPRHRFESLKMVGRMLTHYQSEDLWERDTATLPAPLQALRRRIRGFAEQHLRPLALQADLLPHLPAGELAPQLRDLLSLAAKEGILSLGFPSPFGSASALDLAHPMTLKFALMTEEMAKVDGGLMLLLCAHYLGMVPIWLSGDVELMRRLILPAHKEMRAGKPHLFAFAITEPAGGSDVEEGHGALHYKPGVVARKVPGGWQLSGRKCFISGGDQARSLCVFAALEKEGMDSWTCFYVPVPSPGFSVARTELKMGMRASGAAELLFDQVFVPDRNVVGGLRNGWTINRATLNASRIPVAAMAVGFAAAATEIATRFACQYQLAGKRLIDYQEIQLQLADMLAETRAMRSFAWQTARSSRQPHQLDASACKFLITDRAQAVIETGMEILGNHAGDHERGMEKLFRDVRLTRIFEGTNQINRLAVIEDWQPRLLDHIQNQTNPGV
jgi:alkylation response protein AidB-like acyl-CoA dehydrogenase